MDGSTWSTAGVLVGVLAPLVGVPLTVLTFHLRSAREQQMLRLAQLEQRLDQLGGVARRMREELAAVRRDVATKEEWLRESLWARGEIERQAVALARLETQVAGLASRRRGEGRCGLAHQETQISPPSTAITRRAPVAREKE